MVNLTRVKKAKEKAQERRINEFKSRGVNYNVIKKDGKVTDVRLGFGTYSGRRISEMVNDPDALNYIRNFLLKDQAGFPPKFQNRVRKAYKTYYDDFLDDDIPY